jgi:hypothetical protein
MLTRSALALLATAALVGQTMGLNAHRHQHVKKGIIRTNVRVVTHWVTKTVYAGEESTVETKASVFVAKSRPKHTEAYAPLPVTSQSPAPAETKAPEPEVKAAPTTLATVVVPSPTASPAPATGGGSTVASGSGKRGLAYNEAALVNKYFKTSDCPSCSWAYNWDSTDNGLTNAGQSFVPMLWGTNDVHTSRWTKNVENMLAKGSTHLLSFNEPDFPSQANLSPDSAAAGHVKYMNPYASRAKIGAPAITNSNIAGQGLDWLRSFMSACNSKGCAIDFCVTHWYSPSSAAETLFSHIQQVHEICNGKPVWITEFEPFGSDSEISSFLSTNLKRLDSLSYVERYSYFMVSEGKLVSGNGRSSYGNVYATA